MENLIYILAPIAYFLYQAYQNYQKEQEKARKRNVSDPSTTNTHSTIPEVKQVITEPLIDKETEAKELTPDYMLTKQEERSKHKREQLTYKRLKAPTVKGTDYYNPEISSAEVMQSRLIHEPHNHGKLAVIEDENFVIFDLRDAIIKQAILNRPYN